MHTPSERLRLGISSCLLTAQPRAREGRQGSSLSSVQLINHFDFVGICPEAAIGLGDDREAVRLVGFPRSARAISNNAIQQDVTDALRNYGRDLAVQQLGLSGFVLRQQSASCGVDGVRVYSEMGQSISQAGQGVFAQALMRACPELPVEEEYRLLNPLLLDNFITRVYAYSRWQKLCAEPLSKHRLYSFHAIYKYQLMASSVQAYQALGRLLGEPSDEPLEVIAANYFRQFMQALSQPASRGNHCNVLLHISGYLRKYLNAQDKQELQQLIALYQSGRVPLADPLKRLHQHFTTHPDSYIAQQVYMQPSPVVVAEVQAG